MPDLISQLDRRYRAALDAILVAAIFLTRLPIPYRGTIDAEAQGRAMGWFPLVGALIGLGAGLVFALSRAFGLPHLPAAGLAVAAAVIATGALHEDGLADLADGLGGRDREQKLEIMRDSRIGSYGTLALVLGVGLRVAALASLGFTGLSVRALMVAGAVSRAAAVVMARRQPPARADGLGARLGIPGPGAAALAAGLAAVLALLLIGWRCLPVLALAGAATYGLERLARRQLGGFTGDVLGAVQQLVEIVVLLTLVILP